MQKLTTKEHSRKMMLLGLRNRHGLTAQEMAKILPGGNKNTMVQWLNGRKPVPILVVWALYFLIEGMNYKELLEADR